VATHAPNPSTTVTTVVTRSKAVATRSEAQGKDVFGRPRAPASVQALLVALVLVLVLALAIAAGRAERAGRPRSDALGCIAIYTGPSDSDDVVGATGHSRAPIKSGVCPGCALFMSVYGTELA
jgi:hypothetical protein